MKTLIHTDKKFIESIIEKCDICCVGMADTDGTPYVLPMNFGYKNNTIYLHSAQDGRSIEILKKNPKVCITFNTDRELLYQHPDVACSYRMHSTSVICWGNVTFEEDFDCKVQALDIIMHQYSDKKFQYGAPAVRNVKIWVVPISEITCKEFGAPHQQVVTK